MEVKYLVVDLFNKVVRGVKSFDKPEVPTAKRDAPIFWRVAILAVALVLLTGALLLLTGAGRAEAQGPVVKEVNAAEIVRVAVVAEAQTAPVEDNAAELWVAEPVSDTYTLDKPVVIDRPANPHGVPLYDEELAALYDTAEAWRFNPDLGLALIWAESRYNREAVNGDRYGLCQLKERYFPGASDMTGAENIRAGMTYLGQLLEKYDNLDAALTAYRWGHDNGTRDYAAEVIGKLMEFSMECY